MKRTRTYRYLVEKSVGGVDRNIPGEEKPNNEDQDVQPLEPLFQYELEKEGACTGNFMVFNNDNLSFCCFDPKEDSDCCDKDCLDSKTTSSPMGCSLSGEVFLPFRSIFVSYRCPLLQVPCLTYARKAPLLSSPSMETICSPLTYSYEFLSLSDKRFLFVQRWTTKKSNHRKRVLVVHDIGSYGSFACFRLIPTLLNGSYDLWTFDLRGHGRSMENQVEEEFDFEWLEVWSSDLHQVVVHILEKSKNDEEMTDSLYLYGEGFGASILLDYVIRYSQQDKLPRQIKGVVACGVMLRQVPSKYNISEYASKTWKQLSKGQRIFEGFLLLQKFLQLLGQLLPSVVCQMRVDPTQWGLLPVDFSLLSRDLRVIEALREDSHRLRNIAFQHALTLWELCHQLDILLKRKTLCSLCPHISFGFFHGGDDVLSPVSDLPFYEKNMNPLDNHFKRVEVFVYEKARHYLAHETLPVRRQFLEDMIGWLNRL